MLIAVSPVALAGFVITPSLTEGHLLVRLTGTGDSAAMGPLGECLDSVKYELRHNRVMHVEFDIRALYLLNSSCLKVMAAFLYELLAHGPAVPIRFTINSKLAWQARTLIALERLAPSLVTVHPA